jgi:phospholipase C
MKGTLFAVGAATVLASAFADGHFAYAADPGPAVNAINTASPIKHVIIIVGENRSFDHLFATYVPNKNGQKILNLLSQGIINADGTPGPNFAQAQQYKITSPPNLGQYFISANKSQKFLYATLPAPDVNGVQFPPDLGLPAMGGDPGLPASSWFLYNTGGTGLSYSEGPDIRISNVTTLPPSPFQVTGPTMPYDAYAGDTIHQFFQMYQQTDCAIDADHVTKDNPTGCLHDLQSAVTTTYATPPSGTPHDTGQTMEFFNMQRGDVPYLKSLADQYTMSDNYHQPVMGGTGPDSVPLGFADQVFFATAAGTRQRRPPAPSTTPIRYPTLSINIRSERSGSIARTRPSPELRPSVTTSTSCPMRSIRNALRVPITMPSTSTRRGHPKALRAERAAFLQ